MIISDESVSLYGDTALIGAHGVEHNSKSGSGSVYVFTRSSTDGTFTEQSKFHSTDPAVSDQFGVSVSLYGDTALIKYCDDDNRTGQQKRNSDFFGTFKVTHWSSTNEYVSSSVSAQSVLRGRDERCWSVTHGVQRQNAGLILCSS